MIKRIISVLIVAAILLSFSACAGSSDNGDKKQETTAASADTTGVGTEDEEYEKDALPSNLNFDGERVIMLVVGKGSSNGIYDGEMFAEELNSDVINDSVYNRERFVEDRLGVELDFAEIGWSEYSREFEKQINTDEDMYQICAAQTVRFASFAFDNVLTDLYTVDYLDLEKPWWSQYFNEKAELKGSLYLSTGSLALSLTRFLFVTFYNKKFADDYSTVYPELSDLYSIVDDGDWTYDKFYSLGSSIYNDVNGDTYRDAEDVYGVGFLNGIDIDAMWSSFDINILSRTDDGWFEIDVNEDKLYNALEKIRVLIHETSGCFVPENRQDDGLDELSEKFADGDLLFMVNKLHAAESTTLRNMQDEYGIIPFPKYDGVQKDYYSFAHDPYLSFSIPKTNRNPDIAGAVLEAMASYSYRETHPSYLNVALKGKYMNDPQSRKMVDLIVSGFKLDSAWIYCEKFGSLGGIFRDKIRDNSTSYATEFTKQSKRISVNLKSLGNGFTPG